MFWDQYIENIQGKGFNNISISNNLDELINEPMHVPDKVSQSYTDLICTDQVNFFT